MTGHPQPVGDPVKAFRQTLARAHRAEAEVRRLRALINSDQNPEDTE